MRVPRAPGWAADAGHESGEHVRSRTAYPPTMGPRPQEGAPSPRLDGPTEEVAGRRSVASGYAAVVLFLLVWFAIDRVLNVLWFYPSCRRFCARTGQTMRELRGSNHCVCSGVDETWLDKSPWHSVWISFLLVPASVLLTYALWGILRRLRGRCDRRQRRPTEGYRYLRKLARLHAVLPSRYGRAIDPRSVQGRRVVQRHRRRRGSRGRTSA
jgi:hypothetical protein